MATGGLSYGASSTSVPRVVAKRTQPTGGRVRPVKVKTVKRTVRKVKKASKYAGESAQQRLQRMLADPGLRSKLPISQLPAKYRAQRELRLPVTPGSTMTGADLRSARSAAEKLQFGPNAVQRSQEQEQKVGSYYDAYLRALEQSRQNVASATSQANVQTQALTNAAATEDGSTISGAPLDSDLARRAALSRAAYARSAADQITSQGAGANERAAVAIPAGTLDKIAALTKAGKDTQDLRDKIGAWRTQYNTEAIDAEKKNVLAQQALGQKTDAANTDAALKAAGIKANADKANKDRASRERIARENAAARLQARQEAARAAGQKVNQYGYTQAQWQTMSPAQRQKAVKQFKLATKVPSSSSRSGKSAKGKGPKWASPAQTDKAMGDLDVYKRTAAANKQKGADRGTVATALVNPDWRKDAGVQTKNPVLASAALDAAYDGVLSAGTVKRLIAAGYKPSEVASALGVKTAGQAKTTGSANARKGAKAVGGIAKQLKKATRIGG